VARDRRARAGARRPARAILAAGDRERGRAYALNSAVKLLVGRRRPTLDGLPPLTDTPTRLSFPSAHASTSFAGALCYARLGLPAGGLYALAASLSASRVYLGVHYPSDVLAGAMLGSAVGAYACGGARGCGEIPAGTGTRP